MYSFDEIVNLRQSIRKYKAEKPPLHLIEAMLKSAAKAPSPSNQQPVRFIEISSEKIRDLLYSKMLEGKELFLKTLEKKNGNKRVKNRINAYFRFSEFMFNAPYLFAVGVEKFESLSDKLVEAEIIPFNKKENSDADISTGLALKAFILKGVEEGIASCILTAPLVYIDNTDKIINRDIRINCFVTAGFPDEKPKIVPKKNISEIYLKV